jgi:hypothetical protein
MCSYAYTIHRFQHVSRCRLQHDLANVQASAELGVLLKLQYARLVIVTCSGAVCAMAMALVLSGPSGSYLPAFRIQASFE